MGNLRVVGELRGYVEEGDLIRLFCRGMSDLVGFYQGCLPHNVPIAVFCRSENPEGKLCDVFKVSLEDGLVSDCEGIYETKKY